PSFRTGEVEQAGRRRFGSGQRPPVSATWSGRNHDRLMDVHAPSVGPDEQLDGHAATMRTQLVAPLPVAHPVGRPLLVELRSSFAEAEERSFGEEEGDRRSVGIEGEALNGA